MPAIGASTTGGFTTCFPSASGSVTPSRVTPPPAHAETEVTRSTRTGTSPTAVGPDARTWGHGLPAGHRLIGPELLGAEHAQQVHPLAGPGVGRGEHQQVPAQAGGDQG